MTSACTWHPHAHGIRMPITSACTIAHDICMHVTSACTWHPHLHYICMHMTSTNSTCTAWYSEMFRILRLGKYAFCWKSDFRFKIYAISFSIYQSSACFGMQAFVVSSSSINSHSESLCKLGSHREQCSRKQCSKGIEAEISVFLSELQWVYVFSSPSRVRLLHVLSRLRVLLGRTRVWVRVQLVSWSSPGVFGPNPSPKERKFPSSSTRHLPHCNVM